MCKIAVSQSNYIPWKGYFDLIDKVDKFIIFDNVQYTRRDWRNRNKIFSSSGDLIWLTIPIKSKGNFKVNINKIEVFNDSWRKKHFVNIINSYKKSDNFNVIFPFLEELYFSDNEKNLSLINISFIIKICKFLKIDTQILNCQSYGESFTASEKILYEIIKNGGTHYYTSPKAKAYLDENLFKENGVKIQYISYEGYPHYGQKFDQFKHKVSIIDLMMNTGLKSKNYIKEIDNLILVH